MGGREPFEVRRLSPADLETFQAGMPSWNSREYAKRLAFQDAGLAVQLVAWARREAVGKGMLVFPGHPEWTISAHRETCPEIRDLEVAEAFRGRGAGGALVETLEQEALKAGAVRTGLMVGTGEHYASARRLYERLGYRPAHGPLISSTRLEAEDGSWFAVCGVCTFLVKSLVQTS